MFHFFEQREKTLTPPFMLSGISRRGYGCRDCAGGGVDSTGDAYSPRR